MVSVARTLRAPSPSVAARHHQRVTRSADRILVGVAGGYAAHWRVEPTVVRAAIGLLTLAGGIGAALYGVGILTTDAARRRLLPAGRGPHQSPARARHRRGDAGAAPASPAMSACGRATA